MAYPQGFLFHSSCPSFGPGVILGPRTGELGRSSSGSAFAPYSGSASSPDFGTHLPYGAEPRAAATLNSLVVPGYDPPPGITSLDYHPFGAQGPYPYGDPSYRKNATRDATATLKAWLNEHRKNPYPTKGEKIMLAIITKMTLTQVSTWFANARRRLKKENKMTWTPRNRSEDEDEEDIIDLERNDEDEEPLKMKNESKSKAASYRPASLGNGRGMIHGDDIGSNETSAQDFKDSGDQSLVHPRGPASTGPLPVNAPLRVSETDRLSSKEHATDSTNDAPKPKLWSLAEIAISSNKRLSGDLSPSSGQQQVPASTSPPRTRFPHCTVWPRPLYYTSPFITGYSNYGPLGPRHGCPDSNAAAGTNFNVLHETMLQRAEAVSRDKVWSQTDVQELNRATTSV